MAEYERAKITEPTSPTLGENAKIRSTLHDMNNALEIIIQATYLIGTLDIGPDGKEWLKLLEQGVDQVTRLNLNLRGLIHKQED